MLVALAVVAATLLVTLSFLVATGSSLWFASRPFDVSGCVGPAPVLFHGVRFNYHYEGCGSPGGDTLVVSGTLPNGATESVTYTDSVNTHPPVVTVLSLDASIGIRWQVGAPTITLLVAWYVH